MSALPTFPVLEAPYYMAAQCFNSLAVYAALVLGLMSYN